MANETPNDVVENTADREMVPEVDAITAVTRKHLNRLLVEEAINDDNSVVALHPNRIEELGLFRGDTVMLKGKKRHTTVCIVLADKDLDEGKARLNKIDRS